MRKVAIITGAAGGIGRTFTDRINSYDEIDEIWAVGRNADKLELLRQKYIKVVPVQADLSEGGADILRAKIEAEQPDIRMLINNAGLAHMGLYRDMDPAFVEKMCNVNCTATAVLTSVCIPHMKKGARILNVSSASSFQPNPYLCLYSSSKVFVKYYSRALNLELKGDGISVTAVCPGWVDTGMLPKERGGKKIRYSGMISADKVVDTALKDSLKGKDMSVPGFFAKYFRLYSKYTPTALVMRQWAAATRKYI